MTTYPCPTCGATASLATGCPGCGRSPDAEAAEVIRLDAEIAVLVRRRQTTAARIQARPDGFPPPVATSHSQKPPRPPRRPATQTPPSRTLPSGMASPPGGTPSAAKPAAAPQAQAAAEHAASARDPEASAKLVQTALFLLGGLLLGVAAIVFSAVAWSQFGVGGRAALLALFTCAALGAPLLALRRGLTATAETFAAVGLLLVLLDGYAAWYVNLFGLADFPPYGYAGAVCAVTAAVAAGYEHLTGLTGPRYAALVVAQPVVPLLTQPLDLGPTGWAFRLAAVAALNLVVLYLRPARLTVAAYLFGALAAAAAGLMALNQLMIAETTASIAWAGAALVTVAGIILAGALLSRVTIAGEIAAGVFVSALALASGRVAYVHSAVLMTAAVALIAGAAAVGGGAAGVRGWGARIGALASLGAALLVLGARGVDGPDWQLPVGILLLTAGRSGSCGCARCRSSGSRSPC